MNSAVLLAFVIGYFVILLVVAWFTSRNSNNDSFFIGNRNSNWMLVAFGMIGTSLSGVTFVSVPGTVGTAAFSYFQIVIGYWIGYFVIAFVLLPLYYRLNLTSIYNYLQHRFGMVSYKTGALFFIISRTLGATARLYLVINVLQLFILDKVGIGFGFATFVILLMILLYTFEGGVKTIVYTDTLQTTFMLLGLIVCIVYIMSNMNHSIGSTLQELGQSNLTKIFNTDVNSSGFFIKSILGGMFITIGMTGLDQEMMQKNISVRNLKDSQKNVMTFSVIMLVVNFLFLLLGGILYLYAKANHVVVPGDDLFPTVALKGFMPNAIAIIFIIGLISALFPSADGALTALTSSFCIDILGIKRK
ncbi:MAG TPA: sodium:solute symporter, partial [Flavisolibacter sp.]|nr:sodium:solute symporter [Flavisolibacter sp.]